MWRYQYDALGRRVRKGSEHETVEFVWDGDVVLHEIRLAGSTWSWGKPEFERAVQSGELQTGLYLGKTPGRSRFARTCRQSSNSFRLR